MKKFLTSFLGLTVLISGSAAAADSRSLGVERAVDAFADSLATRPYVEWNDSRRAPRALYGELSSSMSPTEENARWFLAGNSSMLRATSAPIELALVRTIDSPAGTHFIFEQRHLGVAVHGSHVSVHFNREGRVIGLTNESVDTTPVRSNRAMVTPEGAADRAASVINARGMMQRAARPVVIEQGTSTLVVADRGNGARLAFRVVTPTEAETWETFVDAETGELLGAPVDINRYVTGTGRIFNVSAVVALRDNSLRDNSDSATAVPAAGYSTVTLMNLVGNGFLDGAFASSAKTKRRASSAANNFSFDRSAVGFSETMAYHFIDYSQRYIQSLGFTNINNRQQAFSANGTTKDNSWYSTGTKELTFGTGGVDDAEDAEVVMHEYGHSIQDNQVPGFGSTNESGAMGEGFGDYFAASVGGQLSGGFQDTCIMEWDATSYSSSNPPCLRRIDTNKTYPASIVNQVHADGEIWSRALWDIRTAITAPRADKVVLQHHFLISANATMNQAANAIVTAATSLGYSSTELSAIRTALRNRGFTVN